MAIGFVAAGLMGLRQAIPIIMGANIGTTITAQIIAFKLSDYVLGIVLVGFLIMQLAKQGQMKYVAPPSSASDFCSSASTPWALS